MYATDEGPLVAGCPCPTCAAHTRAYLHYLSRAEAPTAARLLTLHNLTFLERLVAGARSAIRRQPVRGLPGRRALPATLRGRPGNGRAAVSRPRYWVFSRMKSSIAWIWSLMLSLIV